MGLTSEQAPVPPPAAAAPPRPPDRRLGQPLLLSWLLLVLCALVPVLAWAATYDSTRLVPGWRLTLAVLVWSGGRLAWLIARGRPRLPEFSLWLFVYIFMGLAPLLQLRTGLFPTTTPGLSVDRADAAALVVVVSLSCVEVGLWLARRREAAATASTGRISPRRATLLGYAGIVLALYYIAQVGVGTLFSTRLGINARRHDLWPDVTVEAIITVAAYVPLLVAVHALVRARREARAAGEPSRGGWLAAGCLVLLLVVVNPVTSPRYVFGTVLLSLIFLSGAFRTPARTRVALLAITAALVFVFPYADVFRTDYGGSNQATLVSNLTRNGDYDAFAQIVNTVGYVDTHGSTDGEQALGVALFWVPRSVWPGKPTDTGVLLAEAADYRFTNLSAPIWSEMYINAAWPGVVALSVLLGLVIGGLNARIGGTEGQNSPAAVGLGIISFYLLIVLRGSLLQSMANLSVLILCALFIREPHAVAENAGPRR